MPRVMADGLIEVNGTFAKFECSAKCSLGSSDSRTIKQLIDEIKHLYFLRENNYNVAQIVFYR